MRNFDKSVTADEEVLAIKKSLVSSDSNTQEEKDFFAENIGVKRVKKGELIMSLD